MRRRHRWFRLACALLFPLLFPPPAIAAGAPAPLAPAGPWRLDYAPERCTLARTFGEGRAAITLQVDSHGDMDDLRAMLIGPGVPKASGQTGDIVLRFTPDSADRPPRAAVNGRTGRMNAVSFAITFLPTSYGFKDRATTNSRAASPPMELLPEARARFEKATDSMAVTFSNKRQATLALGRMAAPMASLRTCIGALQQSWGLDPAVEARIVRPPMPKAEVDSWLRAHFPEGMIASNTSALLPVRVMVDATGKAGQCMVQMDGAQPGFARTICQAPSGPFDPAVDQDGTPVPSALRTWVFFSVQ